MERKGIDCAAAEEARTLRIEADAIRTHVALAVFALLDARADAMLAIEQGRARRLRNGPRHHDTATARSGAGGLVAAVGGVVGPDRGD